MTARRLGELTDHYIRPARRDRACKYWWFDGWDWLVNRGISAFGSPRLSVGPGEMAIDPHIHTLFSHCSISQPESIIRQAVALGLGGIAIMDHGEVRGAVDAADCADYLKARGQIPTEFLVIPGTEVNCKAGHIGALFVEERIRSGLSPAETVQAIHDAGGIAVGAHAFHSTGVGDAVFDAGFDAVETECGSVHNKRLIERIRALTSDERLAGAVKLGGSDAHYVRALASCYTVVKGVDSPTLDSVKEAILAGRCEARCSESCRRLRKVLGRVPRLG